MYYNDTSEKPLSLINIEDVPNLRGFGGYPCNGSFSAQTRRHRLYRSANPGYMDEAGLKGLKDLGIKHIIDLSSRNEATVPQKLPHEKLEQNGIIRHHCPIDTGLFNAEDLLQKYERYSGDYSEVRLFVLIYIPVSD